MTRSEFASTFGMDERTILYWEKGVRQPNADDRSVLAWVEKRMQALTRRLG